MLMKSFLFSYLFGMAASAAAAASPTSVITPIVPPSVPVAMAPVSPTTAAPTAPLAPPSPQSVSPLAAATDADGNSLVAEEVGEDGALASKTVSPDLTQLDSETLASLAAGIDSNTQDLFFDPKTKQLLSESMAGAWQVGVDPLYYELAKRTLKDNKDKAARQSFALALFKDADRAKYAKDLAFEDHNADVVIAQLEGGRATARMELQGLAEKGNRKARSYLGLDKPLPRADAGATAASPTAQELTPTVKVTAPQAITASASPINK